MPNNPRGGGVSRRVEGEDRQELRETMDQLDVPQGMSIIARTAGIGRSVDELQWDLSYLLQLWNAIDGAARENKAPILIYLESSLVIRAIRDYYSPEIGEILIDTEDIFDQATAFMSVVMPDNVQRVKLYRDDIPLFSRFQIEHQIETAYSRTVQLPSGGSVVIDHTEALVAIDVNSARATRGADIEETALRTNQEAADEVARQLRLRDLGGLIVIDFIDMEDNKNQRAVEQRLRDALHFDRARVQMGKISRFGLMELSRQRLRPALNEGSHVTCPRCTGTGVIRDAESSALHVLRLLQEEAMKEGTAALHAQVPVDVATFLLNEKRNDITKLESRLKVNLILIPNKSLETPHHHIERLRHDDPRLDDNKSSFDIISEAEQPTTWSPARAQETKERPEALVKSITHSQPAPVHQAAPEVQPAPAAQGGLLKRLISWFTGGGTAAAQIEASPEPQPATAARRGRSGERGSGQRNDRNRRRERRPDGEARKDTSAQPARNRRQSTDAATPQDAGRQAAASAGAAAAATVETGDGQASARSGRGRRGRGRGRRSEENTQQLAETVVKTDVPASHEATLADAPSVQAGRSDAAVAAAAAAAAAPALAPEAAPAATSASEAPATRDDESEDIHPLDLDAAREEGDDSNQTEPERKRRRRRSRRGRRSGEGGETAATESQDVSAQESRDDGADAAVTVDATELEPVETTVDTTQAEAQPIAETQSRPSTRHGAPEPGEVEEQTAAEPVQPAAPAVAQDTAAQVGDALVAAEPAMAQIEDAPSLAESVAPRSDETMETAATIPARDAADEPAAQAEESAPILPETTAKPVTAEDPADTLTAPAIAADEPVPAAEKEASAQLPQTAQPVVTESIEAPRTAAPAEAVPPLETAIEPIPEASPADKTVQADEAGDASAPQETIAATDETADADQKQGDLEQAAGAPQAVSLNGSSAPTSRQTMLESAGLQLIETRSQPGSITVEEAPVRLGRSRKPRAATVNEPLQQVETHQNAN